MADHGPEKYLVFKIKAGASIQTKSELPDGFRYYVFSPGLTSIFPIGWWRASLDFFTKLKIIAVFYLLNARCWIMRNQRVLLHVVYKEGKKHKLAFYSFLRFHDAKRLSTMTAQDVELGPYWTAKEFRGRSIPSIIARKIIANISYGDIYVITRSNNHASIRVIEKSGFEFFDSCRKRTRLFRLHHYDTDHEHINSMDDKKRECARYDERAESMLKTKTLYQEAVKKIGSFAYDAIYRSPYIYYEQCIGQHLRKGDRVLELCSGMGLHTHALAYTGACVIATDISRSSLKVLSQQIKGVTTVVADMESLPFESSSFDAVAIAGSLSYGEPALVDDEIRRVLRPGGIFICVDSLNHNPIYRFNRWIQYMRNERTRSTMLRIPTMARIQSISRGFKSTEVRFFGAVTYLMPILARIVGQDNAATISDIIDKIVNVRRSAFKFVLIACGRS